jgi:hypothetical protein
VKTLTFFFAAGFNADRAAGCCLNADNAQEGPKNSVQADWTKARSSADWQRSWPWLCWIATAWQGFLRFLRCLVSVDECNLKVLFATSKSSLSVDVGNINTTPNQ